MLYKLHLLKKYFQISLLIFKRYQIYLCNNTISQVKYMGGNENSQPVKYSKQELKNSHPWLQKSWIVKQEDKSYIQSSYPTEEKHYEEWRNNVKNISGMPNSAFLYLPTDMGYVPNDEAGAKDGYVIANYPNYPILLSDEISSRKVQKVYFKQKQLYYLLYSLVAAKVDANNRAQVLGDIKPENVFISTDQKIKVGCLHTFPYERTNYAKLNDKLKPSYNVLLAPEDLVAASQNQLDNKKNQNSETFSIGATVLSAGILDDLADSYDYSNKAFRSEAHSKKTTEWLDHPNYTEIFKSIILSMLNPTPEKRICLNELWTFLSKYKNSILAKEQFVVNNPPTQLETGVSIIRSKIK